MNLSAFNRNQMIQNMQQDTFDVVIVGGGINGAGVARDAISRGLSVALIEASDFASGTSSRSSKLIHGGIRYLESFEFGLVFEALSERRKLFSMAPNLVHPLRFTLPLYQGDRVGMFKMGLGMWLYDALAMFEAPEMHRRMNSKETSERYPSLRSEGLQGSYMYYDAYMDDDRLVLETLRSAVHQGAQASNYVKAVGAHLDDNGKMQSIQCEDVLSGKSFSIRGRHFVSTVGPWTDEVASLFLPNWKKIMRPSKGIHLTFRRDRFPLKDAVVMAADAQKRIVFAIPRHEMVIVGTTDTDFKQDPSLVTSHAEDVDYLLKIVDDYFPGLRLIKNDIVASYSGVRPLVADGSQSESATSREHVIINSPHNITFVSGGKYTTYRAMAEETVNSFLTEFSLEEQVQLSRTQTNQPINPKATEEKINDAMIAVKRGGNSQVFPQSIMEWLVERHGAEAYDVIESVRSLPEDLDNWTKVWMLEAKHAISHTMCLNLKDFYLRRSPLFLADQNHGFQYINALSQVFKEQLGLSEADIAEQKYQLELHLKSEMGWRHQRLGSTSA